MLKAKTQDMYTGKKLKIVANTRPKFIKNILIMPPAVTLQPKKEDGSNVLIIGDSITVRSENDIKELLPKSHN